MSTMVGGRLVRGAGNVVLRFAVAETLGTLLGLAVGAGFYVGCDVKGDRQKFLELGLMLGVALALPYAGMVAAREHVTNRSGRFLLALPLTAIAFCIMLAVPFQGPSVVDYALVLFCAAPAAALFRGPLGMSLATGVGGVVGMAVALIGAVLFRMQSMAYVFILPVGLMCLDALILGFMERWLKVCPSSAAK